MFPEKNFNSSIESGENKELEKAINNLNHLVRIIIRISKLDTNLLKKDIVDRQAKISNGIENDNSRNVNQGIVTNNQKLLAQKDSFISLFNSKDLPLDRFIKKIEFIIYILKSSRNYYFPESISTLIDSIVDYFSKKITYSIPSLLSEKTKDYIFFTNISSGQNAELIESLLDKIIEFYSNEEFEEMYEQNPIEEKFDVPWAEGSACIKERRGVNIEKLNEMMKKCQDLIAVFNQMKETNTPIKALVMYFMNRIRANVQYKLVCLEADLGDLDKDKKKYFPISSYVNNRFIESFFFKVCTL